MGVFKPNMEKSEVGPAVPDNSPVDKVCPTVKITNGPSDAEQCPGHPAPATVVIGDEAKGPRPSWRTRLENPQTQINICTLIASLMVGGLIMLRFAENVVVRNVESSRYQGWCSLPLNSNSERLENAQYNWLLAPGSLHHEANHKPRYTGFFHEQFDLHSGDSEHETIFVPDFGIGRNGLFIHDFKTNMTGIKDQRSGRCFVFPLDRNHVKAPRQMWHELNAIWKGIHTGDMRTVRQTMRVVRPPLSDLAHTGRTISSMCKRHTTYKMEKVHHAKESKGHTSQTWRMKRSVKKTMHLQAQHDDDEFKVMEFAGKGIIEYTILTV